MLKTGFGLLKPVLHLKTYKCYTFLESAHKAGSNDTHVATIYLEKNWVTYGTPLRLQKTQTLLLGGINNIFREKFFSILVLNTQGTNFSHVP